jgi:hypothetical protein
MSVSFRKLKKKLPDGEVLLPGSRKYEHAIFIGNLLYRDKRPACVVMAESDEDVQVTVKFARKHQFKRRSLLCWILPEPGWCCA